MRKRSHESFAHKITFKDMQMAQKLEEDIKGREKKQIRSSEPIQTIKDSMVNMFLVWIRTQDNNTNMYVCIYIDMIVQCDCAYLRRRARACAHSHARTHTHTLTCRDWSHEIPPFIDLTLHCLLPRCRSLRILADPVVFSFCTTSLALICVLLLFF